MTTTILSFPPKANHQHTHTVIFLHGRGDNPRNFVTSLDRTAIATGHQKLPDLLPTCRWVFPQPPSTTPHTSFPQWFDVHNVKNFADQEEKQTPGLRESVDYVLRLIAEEAAMLGRCWDRIILLGISQGAATAAHVLLNLDDAIDMDKSNTPPSRRLGALVGFSCRLPFTGRDLTGLRAVLDLRGSTSTNDEFLRNTPILLEHCADDPLVRVENGRNMRDALREFGAQVTWSEYPTGGHWFNSPDGIDDMAKFLKQTVPGL